MRLAGRAPRAGRPRDSLNHVNSPNFGFAHSAGDSFAAVLNDPETRAADRFQTFPWVFGVIDRRHDRPVTGGWAWGGVNDVGGYSSEQILCTTHFRLYRSIGGDSSELATRTFASRYVAYLMLRTIGSLTQATNPGDATTYARALMTAELGNWVSEGQVGAVYWKVIRWAFEKQGLFQPPGAPTPVVSEGDPPPVDVYIDDGRQGEYPYLQNFWETSETGIALSRTASWSTRRRSSARRTTPTSGSGTAARTRPAPLACTRTTVGRAQASCGPTTSSR